MRVGELKYSSRPPSVAFFPGFLFWWFILKTATTGRKTKLSRRLWWDRFGLYLAARDCDARLTPPAIDSSAELTEALWLDISRSVDTIGTRTTRDSKSRNRTLAHSRRSADMCDYIEVSPPQPHLPYPSAVLTRRSASSGAGTSSS